MRGLISRANLLPRGHVGHGPICSLHIHRRGPI